MRVHANAKALANWIAHELSARAQGTTRGVAAVARPPGGARRLVALIDEGTISGKMAKELFERMARTGEEPDVIVAGRASARSPTKARWPPVIDEVVAAHPRVVEDYRGARSRRRGSWSARS